MKIPKANPLGGRLQSLAKINLNSLVPSSKSLRLRKNHMKIWIKLNF